MKRLYGITRIHEIIIYSENIYGNLRKRLGCFRVYIGDYTTHLCGDNFINHETRMPSLSNQDSPESFRPFFFRGSLEQVVREVFLAAMYFV